MGEMTKTDFTLDVDEVAPENLSHVWGVLSRVAEGLALDGYQVGVRTLRWDDDGDGEAVFATDGPADEGNDQP